VGGGRNPISKHQIFDEDIIEHAELFSKGLAGTAYRTSDAIDSITASTKKISFNSSVDLEEPRVQAGDLIKVLGGPAAGIYSADVVFYDLNEIDVIESPAADSTSTTCDIYYEAGGRITGFDNTNNGFVSTTVQEAIEEAKGLAANSRSTVTLISNGNVSNNEWITYSELTPHRKIRFPKACVIEEITYDHNKTATYSLNFYKNTSSGTPWKTKPFVATSGGSLNNLGWVVAKDDWIRIKYIDQGTNANDYVMVLWCRLL